jgi:hypothetical protein
VSRPVRRLNWRKLLGLCAGLLLPLPLVLLLGAVLRPEVPASGPGGKPISPMLDTEERTRLSTYRRECGLSAECEPPLGCVLDSRILAQYCADSQCTTDAQCPEAHVCRNIATSGDGPLVRFCVPIGKRQQGERCLKLPGDKEAACATGLVCGGEQGWCARPCRKENSADCPEGFFCGDTSPEPVCLPSCEVRGCPEGQECIHHGERVSACAQVYGSNCQQRPCSDGRACEVDHSSARPGKVWMECVERCGQGFAPCAAGMICDGWQCKTACAPHETDPCGEGYHCKQRRPDRPVACYPDYW